MSVGPKRVDDNGHAGPEADENTPLLRGDAIVKADPTELFTEMEMYLQVALLKVGKKSALRDVFLIDCVT